MIDYDEGAALLARALETVIGSRRDCVYVAGPLASGEQAFIDRSSGQFDADAVRQKNAVAMGAFAESLRDLTDRPVLDPSLIRVKGWTGTQHGEFFLEVIDRYCNLIVFMNGWEFSSGATKEFVYALEHSIPCTDANNDPLSPARGDSMIRAAIDRVRGLELDAPSLVRRLEALSELR